MKRKAYDGVYNRYIKRGIDFCLALIGLVIAAIPMAIVAIAIKAESKGPVIFKQDRIGYKGKVYKMYKFRSMCVGAEKGGVYSDNKDSRVTKVGKFIRATSIDELPQFWNILKGEMSLVGTRPPTEDEFLQYEGYHRRRLNMTPGLTGLWQVSGRSDTKNFEEIVAMDVEYIDNWSLKEDIKILFKTVGVVLKGKGAS